MPAFQSLRPTTASTLKVVLPVLAGAALYISVAVAAGNAPALSVNNTQAGVGETRIFWAHNFQFFTSDYRIGATLQLAGKNGHFYIENAVVLSSAVDEGRGVIYVGTAHGGVFRRALSGNTWVRIGNGLPDDADYDGKSAVHTLLVTDSGRLFAGTDHGVYVFSTSTSSWSRSGRWDEGSWENLPTPVAVKDLAAAGDTIYAALGGYTWRNDDDLDGNVDMSLGIRISYNKGGAWSNSSASAGLPKDEDGDYIEVSSLALAGNRIYAATPGGVFSMVRGGTYWEASDRQLDVSTPDLTVHLDESSRDEAEKGDIAFRDYNRWLTVKEGTVFVSTEDSLTITLFNTPIADQDTVTQWTVTLEVVIGDYGGIKEGILGDRGTYMLELSGYLDVTYNLDYEFTKYDSLILGDMRFLDEDSVATIINPRTTVMLLLTDQSDPEYELGGQIATVTYDNGADAYKWSAKIISLREPNKDKRGVILGADSQVEGPDPDYMKLNMGGELAHFTAVTIDKGKVYNQVAAASDGSSMIGLSGDVNTLLAAGDFVYIGNSSGAFVTDRTSFDSGSPNWTALPYLLPYTPTPIYGLLKNGNKLYACSELGFFVINENPGTPGDYSGETWSPDNTSLYSYITSVELADLKTYFDSSTPANSSKGIYDILMENFGIERFPDIDGSDVVTILLHDIHDISEPWNKTSNGKEGGIDQIHGYIRTEDQSLAGWTNQADMVYISTKKASNDERAAAIAHQLVKLMALHQDIDEERWIVEGIAFLGEKLCGFPMPTTWNDFAQASGSGITLISGTPTVGWGVAPDKGSAAGELYTKVSIWMTYLYENLGGANFIKALMDEAENGIEGINTILPDYKPSGSPEDFSYSNLFTAWSIANAVNDISITDPVTKLPYGYHDSLYTAMIDGFVAGNPDSIGIRSMPLQPDESMEYYPKLRQPLLADPGLNSWATVYRIFFTLPATGGPKAWAGKTYRLNATDDDSIAVWLLKHKAAGGFDVKHLTDRLNEESELTFDILAEFAPNGDTTSFTYDKIIIGLSNQSSRGGSAKLIQSTDIIPPEIDVSLVHHAAFPEFISYYIWANEHIHADVTATESPTVAIQRGYTTTKAEAILFHDVGNDSGTVYTGDIQLGKNDTLVLIIESVQDVAGNNTDDLTVPVTLGRVMNSGIPLVLSSANGIQTVKFPPGALKKNDIISLVEDSPGITSLMKGLPGGWLDDALTIFTIGPAGTRLNAEAEVRIHLSERITRQDRVGVYRITTEGLTPAPSSYHSKLNMLTFKIDHLGTYMVSKNAEVSAEMSVLPETYELGQNYPNPFNPSTTISYSLPTAGYATVSIYDMLGREVSRPADKYHEAGYYEINWNGADFQGKKVASGIYFFSMKSGDFSATKKMVLLK